MTEYLPENLAILDRRFPELSQIARGEPGKHISIQSTHAGCPTLLFEQAERVVSLHSRYDPLHEAAALTMHLECPPDSILVILGFGLGYHVKMMLDRPRLPLEIIVWEPDVEVFQTAIRGLDLTELLSNEQLHLLVGLSPREVLHQVTRRQIHHALCGLTVWAHPSTVRLHSDSVLQTKYFLNAAATAPLSEQFRYPRFRDKQLKILILDSGYYLIREIEHSFRVLGHEPIRLQIEKTHRGTSQAVHDLLVVTSSFKPDFLITVNHLGFDADGKLTELLSGLKLPTASWFVDSPLLILDKSRRNVSDYVSIFLWDSDYVDDVRRLGFESVHYLPLATDETIFRPLNGRPNPLEALSTQVSFVGESMVRPVREKMTKLGLGDDIRSSLEETARKFINRTDRTPHSMILSNGLCAHPVIQSMSGEQLINLAGLITWMSTGIYRRNLVAHLAPFQPMVVGDDGWTEVLEPGRFIFHAPLNYYEQLPWFYPISQINLNATSMQMKTGLNQRVFDVPACGAFLLTDWRQQLEDVFEIGSEVVCFKCPEELFSLTERYARDSLARNRIAENGRRRVLAQHTYRHRIERLISVMRDRHEP